MVRDLENRQGVTVQILTDLFIKILFVVFFLLIFQSWAFSQQGTPVGWVTSLTGKVTYSNANQAQNTLELGQEIFNGMTIETKKKSGVRILFKGDNVLTLSQNSKLKITSYISTPRKTESTFDLLWGRVRAAVVSKLQARSDHFEIRTKNAVAGVRGSSLGVDYDPAKDIMRSGCGEGNCYVKVNGKTTVIPIGQILNVIGGNVGAPVPLQGGDPGSYNPNAQYADDGTGNGSQADQGIPEGKGGKAPGSPDVPNVEYDPSMIDFEGGGSMEQPVLPVDIGPEGVGPDGSCCGGAGTTEGPGE